MYLLCSLLFRKDRSLLYNTVTEGANEAEKLHTNNGRDSSVYAHSECDVHMTAEHRQSDDCTDNSLIAVTNSAVSAAPHTARCTDEQCNIKTAESADVDDKHVSVSGQRTSSDNASNETRREQHLTQFSHDGSVLEAAVDCCNKNSNINCTDSGIKSPAVSAESRISKSSSSAMKQSPVQLQPKPTFTLLPVRIEVPLLVVVNTSGSQTTDRQARLPKIAPRPTDTTSGNACTPAVSPGDSAAVGRCDSLPYDLSVSKMQQNAVASVIAQTCSCARFKTAATQTSAPVSRTSKESRASQVNISDICAYWFSEGRKICHITRNYDVD